MFCSISSHKKKKIEVILINVTSEIILSYGLAITIIISIAIKLFCYEI